MTEHYKLLVCAGSACVSARAEKIIQTLKQELEAKELQDNYQVVETGCSGSCDFGPLMVIEPGNIFYMNLTPEGTKKIVQEHFIEGNVVQDYLYENPDTEEKQQTLNEISFFKNQEKIVLRNCGKIDPVRVEDYMDCGGYQALARVLHDMSPEEVIQEVKTSGLRGRGGGGFPTGLKWELARKAELGSEEKTKYIICNADEGDPGAFMDRSIIEGNPHTVIEAMIIAAYAIGAPKGQVYIRAEYPLAVKRLEAALKAAQEFGALGLDIFQSGFDFDIEISIGAGAFVCGEETALINSIQGQRGEPRPKPPFPAQKGLWNQPTVINNVETLANIPPIILNGGEWFKEYGTEESPGTKVFALAGDINNTGLIEVPMGTDLKTIVFDLAGGISENRNFKAAQIGGPSGGVLAGEHLELPLEYDSLLEIGAMMGSGGLVIMDDETCMVDIARYYLDFTQDESCGKCTPCRVGTKRMLEILNQIVAGKGEKGHLEQLQELAEHIKQTSLCGLGLSAPNPVLSTIDNFFEEYQAHIFDQHCPAGVCEKLVAPNRVKK
ncbi:MAG: NADH-ubiquinone oxidoreductase-F iron-sulfur binding region domain-containing protein [Bacillota bacterium]